MARYGPFVALGVIGFFALMFVIAPAPPPDDTTEPSAPTPTETPTESVREQLERERAAIEVAIFNEVNERRQEHGVRELVRSEGQNEIAREHSHDMLTQGFYNHTNPETGERYLPPCRPTGEVLMKDDFDPPQSPDDAAEDIVSEWMQSDAHREIILAPRWTSFGVGVYTSYGSWDYATANFC